MRGSTKSAATLSVCCLTRGPTARVAAQLGLVRDVADELVVALDTSVDEELAHPLEGVADTLVRYPWADPVDRPVGWVHSLCTGDWILWLDDDEVPSAALLGSVRDVIAEEAVTHCFLPRRTLWRDAGHALVEPPWTPDFQLRLVRNDSRLVWFPGITHWPIQAIGPHRYLDTPLYHADLLLTTTEQRRAKVRRYETAAPGRRVAGLPMNDAYFLPEDREPVAVAPVDEPDRETLTRLLALEPWPEPQPPRKPIRVATREEIDAHWHGAEATDDLYRGRLELAEEPEAFAVGEERALLVRVTNLGTHVWPHDGIGWPAVRIGYRWLDDSDEVVVAEGLRTPLPEALAPGETRLVPIDVLAPPRAGRHALVLDLLHESVRWFGCEASVEIDVIPSLCVALLGEDDAAALEAAAALAESAPSVRPLVLAPAPERTTALHGYEAAADPRAYVLGGAPGRGKVAATASAVTRASALVADAALTRLGARPRFAAPVGAAYLDVLRRADALVVIGDAALHGQRGEREALQQRAALLAARTLGLETAVVPRDGAGLVELVHALENGRA